MESARKAGRRAHIRQSRTVWDWVFDTIVRIVLALTFVATLYPLVYVTSMSISRPEAVLAQEVWLFPVGFSLEAYRRVFENPAVLTSYGNTLFYTFFGTIFSTAVTLLAAYPLSRKDFFARNVISKIMVFTMYFSGGMIPSFLLINNLGLYNTRLSMILPGAVNVFTLIIAISYFKSYSDSIIEAARIDGCNDFRIFTDVVFPTSSAIVAVVILYYGVDKWNSYFTATLYLRDAGLQPLQVYLAKVLTQNQDGMMFDSGVMIPAIQKSSIASQMKYALIMVSIIPIMCVYPIAQRYLIKGVMVGALKG